MKGLKNRCLTVLVAALMLMAGGCSLSEKAATLKDDLVNITMEQVALQLENSLNEQFPGVQLNVPQVLNSNGDINWVQFKQTDLANYSFYNMGSYEFRAVLEGKGNFIIQRINHSTGDTYNYAEFKVERVNDRFEVSVK